MSNEKREQADTDPSLTIIDFYGDLAKSWSEAMSRTVSSRGVADFMGRQVVTSFALLSWFARQTSGLVSASLRMANVPSRDEVLALGERLTRLEMAIDDLDAKLDGARDVKPTHAVKADIVP